MYITGAINIKMIPVKIHPTIPPAISNVRLANACLFVA